MDEALTQLLNQAKLSENKTMEEVLPLVYPELKKLARKYMSAERSNHTLQPTALVHEAYFKLKGQEKVDWTNRSQFFGVAAQIMRRLLIDHARHKKALKTGGDLVQIEYEEEKAASRDRGNPIDIMALDKALTELEQLDARQAKIVELRFFAGLSLEEIAEHEGLSHSTVKRDWVMAKAWLFRFIADE